MSLGEIVLVLIVGIIVVGPRNLPPLMRTAGQWIARLRRLTTDLRSQSGIDDILRNEGLDEHLHQLRSLSRMNVVESLIAPAAGARAASAAAAYPPPASKATERTESRPAWTPGQPLREREYPLVGCDSYNALPDDVMSYRTMGAAAATSEEPEGADAKSEEAEAKGEETKAEGEEPAAEGAPEVTTKPEADEEKPAAATETATT